VAGGESLRHRYRLGIGHGSGQTTPPLGVGQLLSLGFQLRLGRSQRPAQVGDPEPRLDEGFPQAGGERPRVRLSALAQESVEPGFQALEHGRDHLS
jgi:hypothetical protein